MLKRLVAQCLIRRRKTLTGGRIRKLFLSRYFPGDKMGKRIRRKYSRRFQRDRAGTLSRIVSNIHADMSQMFTKRAQISHGQKRSENLITDR